MKKTEAQVTETSGQHTSRVLLVIFGAPAILPSES